GVADGAVDVLLVRLAVVALVGGREAAVAAVSGLPAAAREQGVAVVLQAAVDLVRVGGALRDAVELQRREAAAVPVLPGDVLAVDRGDEDAAVVAVVVGRVVDPDRGVVVGVRPGLVRGAPAGDLGQGGAAVGRQVVVEAADDEAVLVGRAH